MFDAILTIPPSTHYLTIATEIACIGAWSKAVQIHLQLQSILA